MPTVNYLREINSEQNAANKDKSYKNGPQSGKRRGRS